VGPRRLLKLAEVAREVELSKDDTIYSEEDAADALYMVVQGRVRLSAGDRVIAEVGPGEAFGTWALVDDAERGQKAECIEDGLALAVHRDEFYDVAAGRPHAPPRGRSCAGAEATRPRVRAPGGGSR
jgi:CRP-like cAMP-binding protein